MKYINYDPAVEAPVILFVNKSSYVGFTASREQIAKIESDISPSFDMLNTITGGYIYVQKSRTIRRYRLELSTFKYGLVRRSMMRYFKESIKRGDVFNVFISSNAITDTVGVGLTTINELVTDNSGNEIKEDYNNTLFKCVITNFKESISSFNKLGQGESRVYTVDFNMVDDNDTVLSSEGVTSSNSSEFNI